MSITTIRNRAIQVTIFNGVAAMIMGQASVWLESGKAQHSALLFVAAAVSAGVTAHFTATLEKTT